MCAWREDERVRRDCEEAFAAADEGQKGYLTAEDYKVAILSLFGYKPSKYEVASVWRDKCSDSDGSHGGLIKERFVSLAAERVQQQDRDGVARQVFLAFDTRCQGFLSEQDCVRAFQSFVPKMARERVTAIFREVDRNEDGRASYRDFEIMMRHLIE
jgi:Ca2+-binding EF-hand superfamily protein